MPWFYVKEVVEGSVFSYTIKNHLVEVNDPYHVEQLRKEPSRFRQLSTEEGARVSHRASSFSRDKKTEPAKSEVKQVAAVQPAKSVVPPQPANPIVNKSIPNPEVKKEVLIVPEDKKRIKKVRGV